jgi:putative ABC transport system permease protein
MLGVIIGVGSVIAVLSLGAGFERYILDQVASVSSRTIDIYPKGLENFGSALDTLTEEDADALKKLNTITSVAPVVFINDPIEYQKEKIATIVFGSEPTIFANYGFSIQTGRLFTTADVARSAKVVVLGDQAAEDLFLNQNPLGQKVTMGTSKYEVIGVLKSVDSALLGDLDSYVFTTITAAQEATGLSYINYVNVQSVGDDDLALADIYGLLRQRHRIDNPEEDPDKDDFIARSAAQAIAIIDTVSLGLTTFLALVAGISLLVGGIGIMNILLVSVTERTQEIGIRKAIGAKRKHILWQFLLEAVALTFTGGMIGLIGGVTFSVLVSLIVNKILGGFPIIISLPAVIIALIMALGTGLLFGIYPAYKAAKLQPIEAMRFE